MSLTRRMLGTLALGTGIGTLAPGHAGQAQASASLKLGVLSDLSGPYRDLSGPGSLVCVNQAIADFRKAGGSLDVSVIQADHQHKADVGLGIARKWFDTEAVDAILEVNNSNIALGVADLARDRDKVFLASGPATDDLYGVRCGPNHVMWTYDTWMLSHGVCTAAVARGASNWFFLTADYAFGHILEREARAAVIAAGAKVASSTVYPFPQTTDFAGFLLQAQASRANTIGLATAGTDLINAVKQANEFGLVGNGIRLVGLQCLLGDVRSMGLDVAQGLLTSEPFYWNLNDRTRSFTTRVLPLLPNANRPSSAQAGAYSATLHYLKTVAAMGPEAAKASGRATIAKMKTIPTDDDCFGLGRVREDGRKLHPVYLFEAKKPGETKDPWDLYNVLSTIGLEEAVRPMSDGRCAMVSQIK